MKALRKWLERERLERREACKLYPILVCRNTSEGFVVSERSWR